MMAQLCRLLGLARTRLGCPMSSSSHFLTNCLLLFPGLLICFFFNERGSCHVTLVFNFYCHSFGVISIFPHPNQSMRTALMVSRGGSNLSDIELERVIKICFITHFVSCFSNDFPIETSFFYPSVKLLLNKRRNRYINGRTDSNSSLQDVHKASRLIQPICVAHQKGILQPCSTMSIKATSTIFQICVLILSFCSS